MLALDTGPGRYPRCLQLLFPLCLELPTSLLGYCTEPAALKSVDRQVGPYGGSSMCLAKDALRTVRDTHLPPWTDKSALVEAQACAWLKTL